MFLFEKKWEVQHCLNALDMYIVLLNNISEIQFAYFLTII